MTIQSYETESGKIVVEYKDEDGNSARVACAGMSLENVENIEENIAERHNLAEKATQTAPY